MFGPDNCQMVCSLARAREIFETACMLVFIGSLICIFEKNGARNNVSRMEKLKKDGEICTRYMNVSKNVFPRFI